LNLSQLILRSKFC